MQLEVEPPFVVVRPVADEGAYYALDEDSPWELGDGRLVMSAASPRHEDLFLFLSTVVRGGLDERGGGVALGSRYPMRLDGDTAWLWADPLPSAVACLRQLLV